MKIKFLGSQKKSGYQAVEGSAGWIPASVPFTGVHATLVYISRLLGSYHAPGVSEWGKLAILGELYFSVDFALKHAGRGQQPFAANMALLDKLYRTVVDHLCLGFQCAVNVLPQKLEDCFGRVLTKHGAHVDSHPDVATYLTRAQAEYYRLVFTQGAFHMIDRVRWNRWVKADSTGIGWTYHPSIKEQMMYPGYAGFALSMGREFYMAHHRGGFDSANFFHSSYLGGGSVLCTGTIHIVNGVVQGVANDSGHYQPTLDHLLNVAQTLAMLGVNPAGVAFHAVWPSVPDDVKAAHASVGTAYQYNGQWWLQMDGATLISLRNRGAGLRNRINRNIDNVKNRGGLPKGATFGVPPIK